MMASLPHIKLLTQWIAEQKFDDSITISEIHGDDGDETHAVYIDLESRNNLGRATVWPEGYADLLVVDKKYRSIEHREVLNNHVEFLNFSDLDEFLSAVQYGKIE
jgi:hypothetical protein